MANRFRIPRSNYIGSGALGAAGPDLCALGRRAFIVAGQSMARQGHLAALIDLLRKNGVASAVFTGITGEPTDAMIEEAAAAYHREGCDFLIGFGGGSPLDAAKAVGILVTGGGRLADYNGRAITAALPPLAEIPSTAGTGSEVTPFTIITDVATNVKMLLKGDALMPTLAIVDPLFSLQTPRAVTVATGLDALTHAVESFTSRRAFPQTDVMALSAVGRIFKALPALLKDGADAAAREQMAMAAFEAGVSFSNSSVTIVHGMSRPIGALFHVPHGLSNAMLLPGCLAFAAGGALDRFAALGRHIGAASAAEGDEKGARRFIQAVADLCAACGVPTLAAYGVDREAFMRAIDKMADDALASGSPANTRRPVTKADVVGIYQRLWA